MPYNHTFTLLATLLLALAVKHTYEASLGLPSYMRACSKKEPDYDACVTKVARQSLKAFSSGDASRGIPRLDPMYVKQVKAISSSNGLNIVLNDVNVMGASEMQIKKMTVDVKKKKIQAIFQGDLNVKSKYEMSGRLLIIPLNGKGDLQFTLRKTTMTYNFDYILVPDGKGSEFMKITTSNLSYDLKGATFKINNLFGGDRILTETTNRLLNEAWRDVVSELGPPVVLAFREYVTNVIQKFFDTVSHEEMFPDA